MRVLIAGATGCVGAALARRLVKAGHRVRGVSRSGPTPAMRAALPTVQWSVGDAATPTTWLEPLADVEVAYYLIHSLAHPDFDARDLQAARCFAAAAHAAGVQRVIYLGGLAATGEGDSAHLSGRIRTGAALAAAGVPVTELRTSVILAPDSAVVRLMTSLVGRFAVLFLPQGMETRVQPIALGDVLDALEGAAGRMHTGHRVVELGGPEVISWTALFQRYARVAGRRRLFITLPFNIKRIAAAFASWFSPLSRLMCAHFLEGLESEALAPGDPPAWIGARPATSLDVALQRCIPADSR